MHAHHGHHDHHHASSFNLAFAIAIGLAFLFTAAEAIFAITADSMSLLADATHNLGDALGLVLAWVANWLMGLPARRRYSYGFKRTTIIAALINAFILVGTSVLIIYESIYKLFHLSAINEPVVMAVAAIGVLVNGGSSLLFMRGAAHDLNIRGAFWHLLADALISVGVVISAIIVYYTGWLWIDPAAGLVIILIVLWGTWGLLRDSLRLMLDAVPHYVDFHAVRDYLAAYPGVKAIHDLHIWGLSTREVALTAHLVMPDQGLSDADYKAINTVLHDRFHVNHVTLQVEAGSDEHPCLRQEAC